MSDNKPIHTINYGAIRVSVWCDPAPFGEVYHVAASRCYRNGDKWTRSISFSEFDLPILSKLLLDAHSFILTRKISQHDVIALTPPVPSEPGEQANTTAKDVPEPSVKNE